MNPDLNRLQPYPFERLGALRADIKPPQEATAVSLSIGEPKHEPPPFVLDKLRESQSQVSHYPSTKGSEELRYAIAEWLKQRFRLSNVCHDRQVLPVNGTREALFATAQCLINRSSVRNRVLMPNPFYQIYEGAAFLAGVQPDFYPLEAANDYQPDFREISNETWASCQLIYICTPANPSGSVIPKADLQYLINKAEEFDFIVASDECYSEIYSDENRAPTGLLEAAEAMGNDLFRRCLVFHSLSKRSNLPGMRSGFVAGDERILEKFLLYRTYHGCSMPLPTQIASTLAWADEEHVVANREIYRQKFASVLAILNPVMNLRLPEASFYLWPELPVDDETFTRMLYQQHNIAVLPGSYLSREVNGKNPGKNHIRMALVATQENCISAAEKIRETLIQL